RLSSAGVLGTSLSGWLGNLAATAATDPKRTRSCILVWMAGGPSQLETFDPKPRHKNGGPIKAIATSVPAIQISEHLPLLAKHMDHLALFRSIVSNVDDHGQGTILMSTGYRDGGPVDYPSVGAAMSRELNRGESPLPSYVSIRSPIENGG